MKELIQARQISKHYGALQVLSEVQLEVAEQEIVAIVGPSGAGKTTLLHILGTLDQPDKNPSTSLTIDGQNTVQMSDKVLAAFRNKNLGFVFQFHELLPEFTALENICIPAWIAGTPTPVAAEKALELLATFGLSDRAAHKPTALSGGEQQRIAVARALINNPKIIFADEPSGNLDSENAAHLHELFFQLREERKCSFVIVTHNESLANRADRKIVLKDGKIIA